MTGQVLVEDELHVALDRWPAHATSPHGITETARVVLTRPTEVLPAEFLAWTAVGRTPQLLARAGWDPTRSTLPLDGSGTWQIATTDGVWTVRPGRGCAGCGSIFRDWTPTSPYRLYPLPADLGSAL